jgi:hypothetical protein
MVLEGDCTRAHTHRHGAAACSVCRDGLTANPASVEAAKSYQVLFKLVADRLTLPSRPESARPAGNSSSTDTSAWAQRGAVVVSNHKHIFHFTQ